MSELRAIFKPQNGSQKSQQNFENFCEALSDELFLLGAECRTRPIFADTNKVTFLYQFDRHVQEAIVRDTIARLAEIHPCNVRMAPEEDE